MIRELFRTGVDVFRLNFSHGTHADHRKLYDTIREIEEELDRPIGILADMQGPKLRIGNLKDGEVMLQAGQRFRLDLDERSEEHTSELQSLMRISYAVFCLKKKTQNNKRTDYYLLLLQNTQYKP